VFGEHFYSCGEFFIEPSDETIRTACLCVRVDSCFRRNDRGRFWELDLISVQCQAVDERFLNLAFAESRALYI